MRLGLRFAATLAILLVIQFARTLVTPLPSIPDVSHLPTPFLTVVIPTVPRRDNSMFIINTIQSFLDQWPVSDADPYFDRLSIVVINHRPEEHAAFDAARLGIMATPLGQHYVTFIEREDEAGIVPLLQRQLVHVRGSVSRSPVAHVKFAWTERCQPPSSESPTAHIICSLKTTFHCAPTAGHSSFDISRRSVPLYIPTNCYSSRPTTRFRIYVVSLQQPAAVVSFSPNADLLPFCGGLKRLSSWARRALTTS